MKTYKHNRLRGFVAGGMVAGGLLCAAHTFAAATVNKSADGSSAVITIPVKIINPRPTCDISVKQIYQLRTLSEGRKNHRTFPVSISCSGKVKSALKAKLAGGNSELLRDNYRVAVSIDEQRPSVSSGPFFWLKDNRNNPINLSDGNAGAFCMETEQNRTCNITPVTEVHTNSLRGGVGIVSVIFNVIYPA
ncbi:hypothetical protein MZB74_21515 [Escherichia coli]|uniref:hypothetical protein n=1 Tax=Escherichia coli TaxID=562 RepID=UPI00137541C1|nr:hypothetical protein [Escherichia coli]MBZ9527046.1 hypothetical protein [Escherichia coli]MCQ0072528.1 hypothetical protein [Escherichia coli]MCQ0080997.1 hypothetical protein [Escherichia coli]MCQ0088949.1 hypothetical protein [Escherichia coli]MCQ0153432.1 hypothetical protein [Escherichia coli]